MIPVRVFENRRVGVLGLGRSGMPTMRALAAGGAVPVGWDDSEAARTAAEAEGFAVADLTRPREAAELAALIVSPGIPHLHPAPHPAVTAAWIAGVPVDNDVGLFFQALAVVGADAKVVAVTGSNGKSTTTALIHHILRAAGRPVQMGGNIGRGVLDLDPPADGEAVVLELSSYQIELARVLAPEVAVFLNLSPDHLDRHGGMGGYFAAKRRLFEMGAPRRMVIGVDDDYGRFLANSEAGEDEDEGARVIEISAARKLRAEGWSVFMNRRFLSEWRNGRQVAAFDMGGAPALMGAHNHQNACAAWAACRALGLGPRQIEAGIASFPGLAHRMERLGTVRGIPVINDSKATNADATEKALMAFERVRLIAGGQPKAGGIEPLRPLFDRIAKCYLIGEAADAFAVTLGDAVPHEACRTLERATKAALAEAQPGEAVLLSPACASWDQFTSFEHRGDAFRALVAHHLDREGGP
ncbi:UDP-N-acetylmuramoyl-L-alanine--D-glutamate ligase [Limibaculum sp. FT325]|uniref:UDP-N-acetylmuramoyl-L-alanine--D-glutamate ligase n=1 Tax=Thermohalobaculum sediminis TaxID=2939436 RepID=UPI0020BFD591|nr:UDP-N-acetylmuramoyl-L-alanine--D-glutamate ligase [Limibaculum sediminis]MCL5777843.1 UDP-N-acetylmuramoyl-L-alanine--D-glutamate ligase [Limibaculum sediminis]